MSKIVCSGCGAWIEDTDSVCSTCGAENKNKKIANDKRPKTILDLKRWYDLNHGPYATKVCIFGSRSKQAGAVGIFKENGLYFVYKNDLSGNSSIMYKGDDEEYAVDFIFSELTKKMAGRQSTEHYFMKKSIESSNANIKTMYMLIAAIIVEWILIIMMIG